MARHATIIGKKGDTWSSIAVGTAGDLREKFKRDKFPGFDRIHYLDTSGGHRRKKGGGASKAKPKGKAKD